MKIRLKEVFVLCCALVLKANAQTPIIISQPQSITVNNASAAAFTVVASNALTYQWQFGGAPVAGATNSTLSLDDVSTNEAGNYAVVVTGSNSTSVTSSNAVLTIVPGTIVQFTISKYSDGSSSNFLVQLFDHDKPATVENFIHYITSGSYSNLIIDRDVANFVIQSGGLTSDHSATNLSVNPVSTGTNSFPAQVDNEFSVGPLIHNRFGTLAMALASGNTNSATSAFFFNTVDNSSYLDAQDFTVFGRILSVTGTNVLDYFNTLSYPDNGIIYGNSSYPSIPVNFSGTNTPTDANFFYLDFAFSNGAPPMNTNPPTISITFPTPNDVLTNAGNLTAFGTSTAADNFAVAEVYCILTTLAGINAGDSATNAAIGTTNWSIQLDGTNTPGVFELQAYAYDGAGNLSQPATVYFTNLVTVTVITNVNGVLTSNQQYFVPGQQASVTAVPPNGDTFLNVQNQGMTSLEPEVDFTAVTNFTLTFAFVSTSGFPQGLTITSPVAGSTNVATNASLAFSGTLPSSVDVTQVTIQLFLSSNAVTTALPAVLNGSTWSLTVNDLTGGPYTVEVVAADSSGQDGFVSETFTVLAPPIIYTQPANVSALVGSTAYFTVVASNVVSYQWQLVGTGPITGATNATLAIPDVTPNLTGTAYQVVLISADGETNTSATAVLTVVTGSLLQITFSGFHDGSSSNVIVQLFDRDKPATVANFLHYITPANESGFVTNVAFSNMIWDRCIPGFILQGGDYDATDRTNSTPPISLNYIFNYYTEDTLYAPPFPINIDSEYNVGPVISNTFGTLAMAINPGEPDTASSGFFFNLADNSSKLDSSGTSTGYTVFGQLISGSNVLQYFNTLSKPDQGLFDTSTADLGAALPDLPVNYHGWTVPANSNLFFADFKLLTQYDPDTTPPVWSINYPTNGQTVTNADVVLQGVSSDNVAVAKVAYSLDGNSEVNAAGTTNWTADLGALTPGTHNFTVFAQDGSGNKSTNTVTHSFFVPRFAFEALTNGNGTLSTNLSGTNTTVGSTYSITAEPAKGAIFVNWTSGTNVSLAPKSTFVMKNGLQMTANFISNVVSGGISITFPLARAQVASTNFSIRGKVATSIGSAQVTCIICSAASSNSIVAPMIFNADGTWVAPSLPLTPGDYIVQAIALGANGRSAVVSQSFTVLAQLTIVQYGNGRVTIPNGTFLKLGSDNLISAVPAPGFSFLSWNAGGGSIPVSQLDFPMSDGLTLTAIFVSNSLPSKVSFTSPLPNTQTTNKNVTLTGKVSSTVQSPQIVCQVFQNNSPLTGFVPATVNGATWALTVSNLTIGDYTAVAIATDATGKTTLASDKFIVNFYPRLAGLYRGLFFDPTSVAGTNAGSVEFGLGNYGEVYGSLTFGNSAAPKNPPYVLYFQMGATGSAVLQAQNALSTTGTPLPVLTINFDLTDFTGVVTGSVAIGSDVYPMTAYRAFTKLTTNTAPSPGTYTLNLEPSTTGNGPSGDSFANVVVSAAGNLSVAGTLADNTPFSLASSVYTNGVWPVFTSFYKGNDMLIGWETNLPSGAVTGLLYWVKNPTNGLYDTNRFSEQLNSFGAQYVAPTPGSNYMIVFGGGSLESPVTNFCSFKNGVLIPASATDKLTGTVSSKGVLKGTIINPFNNEKLPFNGAFISPTEGGGGFTLDVNKQTGFFTISAD